VNLIFARGRGELLCAGGGGSISRRNILDANGVKISPISSHPRVGGKNAASWKTPINARGTDGQGKRGLSPMRRAFDIHPEKPQKKENLAA